MPVRANNPEPVPAASQLAVLPFLSAVDGLVRQAGGDNARRITMHRVMSRETHGYIQQLCTYVGSQPNSQSGVGRMFPIDTGIMGAALLRKKILRTHKYSTRSEAIADMAADMAKNGDKRNPSELPITYLAIPFLGPADFPVLALYAESEVLNLFADDVLLSNIWAMAGGFCRLFDWLDDANPFTNLRNFPFEAKDFRRADPTVFARMQEEVALDVPKFATVKYFNYDASVS